jgi:hypothetical protein
MIGSLMFDEDSSIVALGLFLTAFAMLESCSHQIFQLFPQDALTKHGSKIHSFQNRVRFAQALLKSSTFESATRMIELLETTIDLAKFRNKIVHNPSFVDVYQNEETGKFSFSSATWRDAKKHWMEGGDLGITAKQIEEETDKAQEVWEELQGLIFKAWPGP